MSTITSDKDIDRLFNEGNRSSRKNILVLVAPTQESRDPAGRVIFVAGKRLGGAVTRNRCKRVMRAAVGRVGGPWPGWDVAIVARQGAGSLPATELDDQLSEALRRADVQK